MGLEHNFLYLNPDEYSDDIYKKIYHHPLRIGDNIISEINYLDIHDDIINYFFDYFMWLKLYNPCKKEYVDGLCYHGVTTIFNDALFQLKKIIDGLLIIFSNAPDMIKLHGNYNFSDNYHEKKYIKKEKIIKTFIKLNNLIEKAIEEKGYILHLGI
jgi:hypothetical protein